MDENKIEKNILEYDKPLDFALMMEYLGIFTERYDFLEMNFPIRSLLGKGIPMIKLGEGKNSVIYIASHHASEWLCSVVLLRFINEYCELYKNKRKIYNIDIAELYERKSIYIVPMLNPDGVDIAINGIDESNILYDRLLSMNGGSRDFSHWKANARGVDLNHNYNAGFMEYKKLEMKEGIYGGGPTRYSGESAESEPETGNLCNFIRFNENINMAITLHSQGEEIYYSSGETLAKRSYEIAKYFSRLSGYSLAKADGLAAYGGFTDWFIKELGKPSFTIECGKGENPLPLEDYFPIYTHLREILFMAPMIKI